MRLRLVFLIAGSLFAQQVSAFTCYITLAKDSCWTKFNVTVTLTDLNTKAVLGTVTVPQGQSWARQSFDCNPGQNVNYTAQFSPDIWENDANTNYSAKRFWVLPTNVTGQNAWELPLCFPSAFVEVPMPADATADCQCDFNMIPPITP